MFHSTSAATGHAVALPSNPINSRRLTHTPFYDDEARLSDDLGQGALVIAASRLRLPQWVKFGRGRKRQVTSQVPPKTDGNCCAAQVFAAVAGDGRAQVSKLPIRADIHSMISSARATSAGGRSRPMARAVFMLMMN